jgi:hypothetical protein
MVKARRAVGLGMLATFLAVAFSIAVALFSV